MTAASHTMRRLGAAAMATLIGVAGVAGCAVGGGSQGSAPVAANETKEDRKSVV